MKTLIIFGCLLLSTSFVFGQRISKHDPTYSDGNYKQPNKAAYARQHNLDRHTALKTTETSSNDNYKQPFSKSVKANKVAMNSTKPGRKNESYKHPNGL